MPTFDSARMRLLLRDIASSTRGEMAGLQVDSLADPDSRLRITGDRLALVRLGVQLAEAALSGETGAAVDRYGHVREAPAQDTPIEIVFSDTAFPGARPLRRWSPHWWRPFAAGAALGFLMCGLLCMIVL
jgi:hypothetical protein